jgi:O-antigen/teichoic acid export membrane protein
MADTKKIAKNTMFMYIRMLFIMGVSLYTSRVVLDKLGVDDFSLYTVVGGIVGMLSFLNGTLSTGTSRYITFALGKNDTKLLNLTFTTTFYTHLVLAIIFVILLETGGLWYIYNKLVVQPERFYAALIVFHISVFSALIGIMQVPYTSLIMAHEDLNVYAYVGILDAIGRLMVVFLLGYSNVDKLVLYAFLLAIVQIIVALLYYAFCHWKYVESRLRLVYDKVVLKSLLSFSSWNVLAQISETLKLQGYLILLNLFFQPYVIAAQSIGNQVATAMMSFVGNFRSAINPQIIKLYAAGEYEDSKNLTFSTTILSFDLVLLLGLPSILVMNTIMNVWLVDVPPYAVIFTQFIIIQRILGVFESAFYMPQVAAAKIKTNSILGSLFGPVSFAVLYFIYRFGGDVMWMQYIGIITIVIWSFVIKPCLLVHDVEGYAYSDFIPCFVTCLKVSVLSITLSYIVYIYFGNEDVISSILSFSLSLISVLISSFLFLDKNTKSVIVNKIIYILRNKIAKK